MYSARRCSKRVFASSDGRTIETVDGLRFLEYGPCFSELADVEKRRGEDSRNRTHLLVRNGIARTPCRPLDRHLASCFEFTERLAWH